MGSKNSNGRKTLALLAATATLAGGLTEGTAYAGGGGGDQGGTGGGGSAAQFWAYKDDGDCRVVAVGAASGNGSTTSVWKRVRRLRREDMEGQLVQEHRAK